MFTNVELACRAIKEILSIYEAYLQMMNTPSNRRFHETARLALHDFLDKDKVIPLETINHTIEWQDPGLRPVMQVIDEAAEQRRFANIGLPVYLNETEITESSNVFEVSLVSEAEHVELSNDIIIDDDLL